MNIKTVSRIGPKGQVVLRKPLRDSLGLKIGMMVEEQLVPEGILIRSVDARRLLRNVDTLARKVSQKWPKGVDAATAVRKERK